MACQRWSKLNHQLRSIICSITSRLSWTGCATARKWRPSDPWKCLLCCLRTTRAMIPHCACGLFGFPMSRCRVKSSLGLHWHGICFLKIVSEWISATQDEHFPRNLYVGGTGGLQLWGLLLSISPSFLITAWHWSGWWRFLHSTSHSFQFGSLSGTDQSAEDSCIAWVICVFLIE